MLASTLFFALMNVGVKYLSHIPAHEIVFFRALVTLVVGYALIRRAGLNPWGNNKKLLLLRGASGTAALVMYFYTLQNMPLASAVTIQYLSPMFTIVIASFMLKENTRPIQWLFFLVSFAGVLMIKGFDTRVTVPELLIGMGAAVGAGFAYNFVRKLKDYDHPLVVVFYFPLVTVPVVGLYTVTHWTQPSPLDLVILLLIGLATTAAQVYMTRAYQLERAANISNFNYLGTVYAIIIGYFMFGEVVEPLGTAGIVLIILGVMLGSRFRQTGA
ncbi:MAG: DMT family transporter [candidate division Zixibacteria bacterium]|nr:DMT family transporter [candidate division Zixibacteria bacterium]